MPTPSIQTLRADAQQVLNLDSISAVRSVVAATLANANAGTPLNPNLTTQQLWNEFYQIVTQPKSDIESIIANQLMKFLFAPPAPGGVGANGQVIFNDGGVLAGDPQFLWNKTTNQLTVTGAATITGDLTVRTNGLVVNATGTGVQVSPSAPLCVKTRNSDSVGLRVLQSTGGTSGIQFTDDPVTADWGSILATSANLFVRSNSLLQLQTGGATERLAISSTGVCTWSNVGGVAGTAMTLNATGLGIGVTPSVSWVTYKALEFDTGIVSGSSSMALNRNCYFDGVNWRYKVTTSFGIAQYQLSGNGNHIWNIASSGSAGAAINGGTGAWTQAMTLDASGNLLVGTTTAGAKITALAGASGQAAIFQQPAQNFWCVLAHNQATSGDNSFVLFGTEASFTSRGSITYNRAAGQVSYNITSDYRLKGDVKPLTGALNRISSLKPSTYKFKETGFTCEGFIAHELAEVIPAAVTGEKDAVNEDGSIKAQGVDLSKVVPILVAAIQELTARVQTLETR